MTKKKIWLSSPHMGGGELKYIHDAFESNWIAPLGPNVSGFEKALEDYLSEESHVAALSSGTAAIHLGLKILGVGPGDDVLCQSLTFSASANPINYLGANAIFIDSEKDTWNISPSLLENAIRDRMAAGKKPKAIIAVHLYGMPYKVGEITSIARRYEIPVLEDSAEALGSSFEGVKCGNFGEIGILSFNGNKIITTSGGGALVSRNESFKSKAIFLATQARDKAPHYQHSEIGHNYRMSNIIAGIGRGQMEVLNDHVQRRRDNYYYYKKHLGSLSGIEFLEEEERVFCNRWLTCILTPSYSIREKIREALLHENVESRPIWKPMHMQPVFQKSISYTDGTSEDLFRRGLCLPSGSNLSDEDLDLVVQTIIKTLRHND